MNEYLEAFKTISQSIEELLTDKNNSQEIKQSAENLKASLQPCVYELQQFAIKLKMFIGPCFKDLDYAKNLWDSKPIITAEPKDKIWEQLGELSGGHFQIYNLGNHLKLETVKEAKNDWEAKIEELRNKWFIDSKGQPKKGVGWNEKEGFIKDVRSELESAPFPKINDKISERLRAIDREFTKYINLEIIQSYIKLFDWQRQIALNRKLESLANQIESNFGNKTDYIFENSQKFKDAVKPALTDLVKAGLTDLVKQRLGDISWEEVVKFQKEVALKVEATINSIFEEKIKLLTKAIDEAIAFYNEFLERQERYQQETPEQRQAEKDWIDKQRQELERLQKGIELIINPFAR